MLIATLIGVIASSAMPEYAKAQTAAPVAAPPVTPATPSTQLARAKSWGYQLQKPDPKTLSASPYDVLVIDYSRDGGDEDALSAQDLELIKRKPDGTRRVVLAYLSIGEAEDYRYYWKKRWAWFSWLPRWSIFSWFVPTWLGAPNKEWKGNFAVRFWQDAWQSLLLDPREGYLQKIVKAGFDGVYLDKIDSSLEEVARARPQAKADMIAFVKRLAAQGRAIKPGFLIVPQNGEELLGDAAYRAAIDGLGKEDILYGEDRDEKPNKPTSTAAQIEQLTLLTAEGKPVFAVEYLDNPQKIAAARTRLVSLGFIPYFADRALDHMRMTDLPVPGQKKGRK